MASTGGTLRNSFGWRHRIERIARYESPTIMAEQDHWTKRGRVASVSSSDVTSRPRQSVLSLDRFTRHEKFTLGSRR